MGAYNYRLIFLYRWNKIRFSFINGHGTFMRILLMKFYFFQQLFLIYKIFHNFTIIMTATVNHFLCSWHEVALPHHT